MCRNIASNTRNRVTLLALQFDYLVTVLKPRKLYNNRLCVDKYPGQRSHYSDWLRAARPGERSSSPCEKNFYISMSSRPALRPTQSSIQWIPAAVSPGVKRPRREADHSPPTSADIKKTWVYTLLPHTSSWRSA
jgi:hypothetical protein